MPHYDILKLRNLPPAHRGLSDTVRLSVPDTLAWFRRSGATIDLNAHRIL